MVALRCCIVCECKVTAEVAWLVVVLKPKIADIKKGEPFLRFAFLYMVGRIVSWLFEADLKIEFEIIFAVVGIDLPELVSACIGRF